jgi:hypothetical protein
MNTCPRRTFAEETAQVPRRARSTRRLRGALVAAVIGSGRAAAEAVSSFGVSWWLVQRSQDSAALTLPNVDAMAPRMLGIDEHRYRSARFFHDPATKAWKRYEPWMTTIVDLDTGQVLGIVDAVTARAWETGCLPAHWSGGLGCRSLRSTRQLRSARLCEPGTSRLWRTVCRWWKEI